MAGNQLPPMFIVNHKLRNDKLSIAYFLLSMVIVKRKMEPKGMPRKSVTNVLASAFKAGIRLL